MYMNIGNVNGIFHTEAITRKANQGAGNGEEKKSMPFRFDVAQISQKGKTMSAVERLMKQKEFIKECKDSLLEQMTNKESGYCSADIAKKVEEYEKQLESIDQEIAKEMAKPADGSDSLGGNKIHRGKRLLTKQELNNKRMAELTQLSGKLEQSEVVDSVKDRLEGEKHVLEAELKIDESERKRERVAEIDDRTEELTKETFAKLDEIIDEANESKEDEMLAEEEREVNEEEN